MNDKAKKLYSILLSIYYNDYNDITDEEKEKVGKRYNPNNLLIKGQKFIERKVEGRGKSKSQPEEIIAERVKLRRQKEDFKDLFDTSSPSTHENDDDSDEFIDIPGIPPLEGK